MLKWAMSRIKTKGELGGRPESCGQSRVMLRPAMIRIKTEEELGGRPKNWNHSGGMDYLFGRTVHAIRFGGLLHVINQNMDFIPETQVWCIPVGHVEVLEVLNG